MRRNTVTDAPSAPRNVRLERDGVDEGRAPGHALRMPAVSLKIERSPGSRGFGTGPRPKGFVARARPPAPSTRPCAGLVGQESSRIASQGGSMTSGKSTLVERTPAIAPRRWRSPVRRARRGASARGPRRACLRRHDRRHGRTAVRRRSVAPAAPFPGRRRARRRHELRFLRAHGRPPDIKAAGAAGRACVRCARVRPPAY